MDNNLILFKSLLESNLNFTNNENKNKLINKLSNEILKLINNNNDNDNEINNQINNYQDNDLIEINEINEILFKKIWNNLYIKNQIFKQIRIFNNHYFKRYFSIKKENIENDEILNIIQHPYSSFLNYVHLSFNFDIYHFNEIIKLINKLPNNIKSITLTLKRKKVEVGQEEEVDQENNQDNEEVSEPISNNFEKFQFNMNFNKMIGLNVIPNTLKTLSFEYGSFNQPLHYTTIIDSIKGIKLIEPILPRSGLTTLDLFHSSFNQIILPDTLPCTLKTLKFGKFNKPFLIGSLPNSLTYLHLGGYFNQYLQPGIFGNNLKYLNITSSVYSHKIDQGVLPNSLETLSILQYQFSYQENVLPYGLKYLKLTNFQTTQQLPSTIETLEIQSFFDSDQLLNLPKSLTTLQFHPFFTQKLDSDLNPFWFRVLDGKSLKKIDFSNAIKIRHNFFIPNSVTSISGCFISNFKFINFQNSNGNQILKISINFNEYDDDDEEEEEDVNEEEVNEDVNEEVEVNEELYDNNNLFNLLPKNLEILKLNSIQDNFQYNENTFLKFKNLKSISLLNCGENVPIFKNTEKCLFPDSCLKLKISGIFRQPIQFSNLPKNLKHLSIKDIQCPIGECGLSESKTIETLEFGFEFDQTLTIKDLPYNIKTLIIWGIYTNIELPLPKSLDTIYLYNENESILVDNLNLFTQLSNLNILKVVDINYFLKIFKNL